MSSKRPLPDPDDARTPSNRSVRSRRSPVPATMSSRPSLTVIPSLSPIWTMELTTCLSLRLDPGYAVHRNVICRNCIRFWEDKLKMDISKYNNQNRPVRMFCDRPFDCSNGATETKVNTCEKLKGLFVAPVVDPASDKVPSVGHFVTPGKRQVRGAAGSFISSASSNKHKTLRTR